MTNFSPEEAERGGSRIQCQSGVHRKTVSKEKICGRYRACKIAHVKKDFELKIQDIFIITNKGIIIKYDASFNKNDHKEYERERERERINANPVFL